MAIPTEPRQIEDLLKNVDLIRPGEHDPFAWLHEMSRSMLTAAMAKLVKLERDRLGQFEEYVLIMPDGTPRPAVEASVDEAVRQITLKRGDYIADLPTDGGPGIHPTAETAVREQGPVRGRVSSDQAGDAADGETPLE